MLEEVSADGRISQTVW